MMKLFQTQILKENSVTNTPPFKTKMKKSLRIPPTFKSGFGLSCVSGNNLLPNPAANINAFILNPQEFQTDMVELPFLRI